MINFYSFLLFFLFSIIKWPMINRPAVHQNLSLFYETSSRGNPILVLDYNRYVRNRESKKRVFWRCTKYYQTAVNCPGSLAITKADEVNGTCAINITRNHNELCEKLRLENEKRSKRENKSIATNWQIENYQIHITEWIVNVL